MENLVLNIFQKMFLTDESESIKFNHFGSEFIGCLGFMAYQPLQVI